jgi:hypothetical protein
MKQIAGFIIFLGLLNVPFVLATEHTVILQQGLNGYSSVSDTWVSANDWATPPQYTVNYGQNEDLVLGRDGDDNPLLLFDLSSIPQNALVLEATLELYNQTDSSSGSGSFDRRIRLFQLLRAWDEGNQSQSPVDASGKHGATGEYAFDYFPGEGTDIAWNARGMQAGTDYAQDETSHSDVADEGWYDWDVTNLVKAWARHENPNFGMVLRDATGYQDGHTDWRAFCSSQHGTSSLRPKLTIRYNPDVPFASAGPDQENFDWDGTPVTLDGTGSHDRPGGNDATLTYSWEIETPAFGSSQSGIIGNSPTLNFQPDIAGEWCFKLIVTNDLSESSSDTVSIRILTIASSHPRIYITPAKLALLRSRAVPGNIKWTQLEAEANEVDGPMHAKALVGLVSNDNPLCDEAVTEAIALMNNPNDWSTKSGDIALVFDWCFHRLSASQITDFITYFNDWGQDQLDSPYSADTPGWGNYWPRYGYSFALIGLATYGHNVRARDWFDEFRIHRYKNNDLSLLNCIGEGGGWPEGMIYDWIANPPRIRALEAWRTTTGEDLFQSSPWFMNRLGWMLLRRLPGTSSEWGYAFHPYDSLGDTERNRGSIGNYERIMALILLDRFPSASLAPQLQAYLSEGPTANSNNFLYHEEFLWVNPDAAQSPPTLLTHFSEGTGTVMMRSSWPSNAEDTDTSATHIIFQCGDHFTYHQHYDQNSFTLFKYSDLALDSGVYSGDGLSYHDRDYYVRTIAHNTLVVYNPHEDFTSSRPDAESVDGGQRSMYPATRAPETVEYFTQHSKHYETGNITAFEDDTNFTFMKGDATSAYNNSVYNQAMDTGLAQNTAKVNRFIRSLVYLRPDSNYGATEDYIVLMDRVGVTQAAYSGANTKLLFHVMTEPQVSGTPQNISAGETLYTAATGFDVVNGDGQLKVRTLWPVDVNMRKVGSRGQKSFWVFDQNVDWHWGSGEPQPRPINDFETEPYGEWRVELEPSDTALEHSFLTILMPGQAASSVPATALVDGGNMRGIHVLDSQLNRVCLFSSTQDGSAPTGLVTYEFTPTATTIHIISDLTPNQAYDRSITYPSGHTRVTLTPQAGGTFISSNQGILHFFSTSENLCLSNLHSHLPSWPAQNILTLVTLSCP